MFFEFKMVSKKILSTVKIEIFLNCQKFFQHFSKHKCGKQ